MIQGKWTIGKQQLVLGDALSSIDGAVGDGTVDLVFADPPYNLGKTGFRDTWASDDEYLGWCRQWIDVCVRKLAPSGALYLMSSTQNMPYLDVYVRDRMDVISRIVWTYDSSGVQAKTRFGSLYEPILYAVKDARNYTFNSDAILVDAPTGSRRKLIDYRAVPPRPYNTKKVPGNVWCFPRVRYRMPEYRKHQAQKPEALLERIVLASTNPEDLLLDPFAGTFTTAAVAERLGRRSVGIEVDAEFVAIGRARVAEAERASDVAEVVGA